MSDLLYSKSAESTKLTKSTLASLVHRIVYNPKRSPDTLMKRSKVLYSGIYFVGGFLIYTIVSKFMDGVVFKGIRHDEIIKNKI